MVDLALLQSVSYIAGALGVCVAAVFYVLNLRISQRNQEISMKNQELMLKAQEQSAKAQQQTLETRQAQLLMNIYDKQSSKEFNRDWDKLKHTPIKNWEDLKKAFRDQEFDDAYMTTEVFYNGVGVLVQEGLLPIRMIALMMCAQTRSYGEKFLPVMEEARRATGFHRWMDMSEYLYTELLRYLKEHPELDSRIDAFPSEMR